MKRANYYIPDKIAILVSEAGEPLNCSVGCEFINFVRAKRVNVCRKFHTELKTYGKFGDLSDMCDEYLTQIALHKPFQKLIEP